MANKLNYQQSREIRKTKFSDLFLDTLARKETGVLGSVGKAISLKSQARMKGIKEKFDPLNIVKFLTFGSKLGPALYGKMAGRDQKDIDYFTGRSRHITGGRNTADKIKGKGGGDNEGINEQLAKIFTFLKSNREDDVKLKQQAKNSEEEINMEKDRRHKELLKTLEKLMKQIGGGSATATKEGDRSFLDGLWDKLKGLADLISDMKGLLFRVATKIGIPISRALLTAGRFGLAALPYAAAAATAGALIYGADFLAGEYLGVGKNADGTDITIDDELDAANWEKFTMAEKIESGAARAIETAGILSPNMVLEAKQARIKAETDYLKKKAAGTATQVTEPEAPANMEFDADGGLISAPPNKFQPKPAPVVPVNTPQAPANMEFDADGGLINSPVPKKLEPVSAPASAPVSNLTNTNVALNLPSDNSGNSGERMSKTNNVAMNSRSKGRSGLMPSQISVRNEEPTYNELIAASTRMI